MQESGVEFALIHGADRLEGGPISDVDLVVGAPPLRVVEAARDAWASRGLHPVVLWPYDAGGAASLFLATTDASAGTQLDLLYDLRGVGAYRVRSGELLSCATAGAHFPEVSAEARWIYLWRKAHVKGQADRQQLLRRESLSLSREVLDDVAAQVFGAKGAYELPLGRWGSSFRKIRYLRRLRHPVGFWAHCKDLDVAEELSKRTSTFLVSARCEALPQKRRQIGWYFKTVFPSLMKPTLLISHAELSPLFGKPDVLIRSSDPDIASKELIGAMSGRFG